MMNSIIILKFVIGFTVHAVPSFQRSIHVSHDERSSDVYKCGTTLQPCASIKHALVTCKDGDTILLDASSKFLMNSSLVINKNIHIESYETSKTRQYATIQFNGQFDDSLIEVNANLSLSGVMFSHDGDDSITNNLFTVKNGCKSLVVDFCYFVFGYDPLHYLLLNETMTFARFEDNESQLMLVFHNSIFHGILHFQEQQRLSEQTPKLSPAHPLFHNLTMGIHLIDCQFYNASFNQLYSSAMTNAHVSDTVFKDAHLSFSGLNVILTSCFSYDSEILIDNDQDHQIVTAIEDCEFNGSWKKQFFQNLTNNVLQKAVPFLLSMFSSEGMLSKVVIRNCIFKNALAGALFLNSAESFISNTSFIDNTIIDVIRMPVDRAAGITADQGALWIHNCSFIGNSAPTYQPSSIRATNLANNLGLVFMLKNSALKSTNYQYTKQNTLLLVDCFVGKLETAGLNMSCQSGQFMKTEALPTRYLKVICISCDGTQYNAKDASSFIWDKKTQRYLTHNVTCYDCPYQATCIGGIRSKGNYWGLSNNISGYVTFYLCPPAYCCASPDNCDSYNTCNDNRQGLLCGDCIERHVISLFSQSQCVDIKNCGSERLFWVGFVSSILATCTFLLYGTEIWNYFKSLFKGENNATVNKQGNQQPPTTTVIDHSEHPYDLIQDEKAEVITSNMEQNNKTTSQQFSGVIKITFFFYQTVSIIRIIATAKDTYRMPHLVSIVLSLFNIRIDIITGTSGTPICPLNTSNPIKIELLKSSLPLISLATLCLLMLACLIAMTIRKASYRAESQPQYGVSFMRRVKGAYVNLLLLGYMSVAVFCFHAVHCIEIDGEQHLYKKASIKCYQLWQHIIIAIICLWIVPFPTVLYFGCRQLRAFQISPNEFLVVLIAPVSALYYIIIRPCCRQETQDEHSSTMIEDADHILLVLNGPFQSDMEKGHHLIWEPMLITRRLILAAATTLITNQIMKLYLAGLLLAVFSVHDYIVKPFSHWKLNLLQTVSTHVLILLAMSNLFWAYSNDVDLLQNKAFYILGQLLLALEMIVLCLPVILLIYFCISKAVRYLYRKFHLKQA